MKSNRSRITLNGSVLHQKLYEEALRLGYSGPWKCSDVGVLGWSIVVDHLKKERQNRVSKRIAEKVSNWRKSLICTGVYAPIVGSIDNGDCACRLRGRERNEYVVHGADKCVVYDFMCEIMSASRTSYSYYLYATIDKSVWCEEKDRFEEVSCGMWGDGFHNDHPCWVLVGADARVDMNKYYSRLDLIMHDSLRFPHMVEISGAAEKYWLKRREKYRSVLKFSFDVLVMDTVLLYV
jgi:hypothetical protein